MTPRLGTLPLEPYRADVVAAPVAAVLDARPDLAAQAWVVEIDPSLADTQALNDAYEIDPATGPTASSSWDVAATSSVRPPA